jgi:hypothetical protein
MNENDELFVCSLCDKLKEKREFYAKLGLKDGIWKRCRSCCSDMAHKNNEKVKKERTLDQWKQELFKRNRRNAIKEGIKFTIELNDIEIPEFCPVLGIKMIFAGESMDAYPSLDKIVPELGYIKGNVCIISGRANRIKNNGTAEEHEKIVKYIKSYTDKQIKQ